MRIISSAYLWFKVMALAAMVVASLAIVALVPKNAHALNGFDFDAGRIIDDGVFYNSNTMSLGDIQLFLNAKVPTCDTNGSKIYSGSTTRAQYGASRGYPAPYTCLKDYSQSVQAISNNDASLCKGSISSGSKSAAQIIYEVAQACRINPKVLLVLLQKEQSLVTDDWPWSIQYRSATGYGCPDTAPCDAEYYGFFNQVYQAAKAYKRYQANTADYNYVAGRNNTILWNPNAGCGSSSVYIENQATAGLYIYTPYRPNNAALSNLYGSGDSCSSYGNRNFWRFFNDWFGSTRGDGFQPLATPRWMQIKNSGVTKVYVYSSDATGTALEAGQQLRFVDKIFIDGKWYLRSEYDHNANATYGISLDNIQDVPYQPITPKWLTVTGVGNRSHPSSRTHIEGDYLPKGTSVKVVDQINIDGNIYFRTAYNHDNNQDIGIHSRFLTDFAPIPLEDPRNFCTISEVEKINPLTKQTVGLSSENSFMINKKTLIDGVWYYQTSGDNGTANFINSKDLRDICYVPFENPRKMRLNKAVNRFNPLTNNVYDTLPKDQVISLSTKVILKGQWYYRTEHNTVNNIDAVMPASAFSEL